MLCPSPASRPRPTTIHQHYLISRKAAVGKDVLRHWSTGPWPRTSASVGASSHSRLSLYKIPIRIIVTVKSYFLWYFPNNWEFRTTYQLTTVARLQCRFFHWVLGAGALGPR
ncbi:hypothetical protein TNCV_3192471 [Trichonephila clavipes]|nr:hypothetical protein TNCV_3192471 [Trichonephila clavipes]